MDETSNVVTLKVDAVLARDRELTELYMEVDDTLCFLEEAEEEAGTLGVKLIIRKLIKKREAELRLDYGLPEWRVNEEDE